MKKLIFSLVLISVCVPLGACATIPSTQPVTYMNGTMLDEQGAITAELAYKSWRIAAEAGVKSGLIHGATATKVAALDNKLYSALTTVENAYTAGNAESIQLAVTAFNKSLDSAYSLIGGK